MYTSLFDRQTTSSLYTGQTVIEMVQDTIVAAMISGEEEVIETPRLQMEVSMMRGDELNGTVQSAGGSTVKIPASLRFEECVVIRVSEQCSSVACARTVGKRVHSHLPWS